MSGVATPELVAAVEPDDHVSARATAQAEVDLLFRMSPVEFGAESARNRDVILFIMLREMAGEVRSLVTRVDEWEAQAKSIMGPDGLLGGMMNGGMGGLMKGLF